jgi:peptidase U49-like protein
MCLIRSPLEPLMHSFAASPFTVAPERKEELKRFVDARNIEMEINPICKRVYLDVAPPGKISFGIRFGERLWAYCYAYLSLMAEIEAHGEKPDTVVIPGKSPWMRLLRWALENEDVQTHSEWPEDLPQPQANPEPGTVTYEATECFLCLGGWMLLHEIGHVACGHIPPTEEELQRQRKRETVYDSKMKEFEADKWATHWMLDRWREYSPEGDERVFTKRILGIVMGLAIITSFEVYHRTEGWPTHPDPAERLRRFLDTFSPESPESDGKLADAAWYVASVVLQLHLENAGKAPPRPATGYASFRDYLLEAVKALGKA